VTAEPAPPTPPLDGEVKADVVVIGGGYTGLSAALHLAQAGTRTVLLEAHEPGWGASGRNGGQVIPGLKFDPDEIEAAFGAERGRRIVEIAGGAADFTFALIKQHGIRCTPERRGWIQGAHARSRLPLLRARAEQWSRRGADVRLLDAAGMAELTGSTTYVGGVLDRRGGALQPLSYARGLAQAALTAGAAIHGGSPALAILRQGTAWRVTAPAGAVTAETVLICTNGYTGNLWPGLKQSLVPVNSFQVATRPLSDNIRRSVLPEGLPVSDTRRLLRYFRLDPSGRLLMGGRGSTDDASGSTGFKRLRRLVASMFPQIGMAEWDFAWSGKVALTADHLPHIHEPAPGIKIGLGYNGRGVAMASRMGKLLADRTLGAPADEFGFPVTSIRPLPFWSLRQPVLSMLIGWYRLRDLMD
jgi:glycine/D-amino acid oxidase-like deaminating enzyme